MKKNVKFTKERRERMVKALELKEQGATYAQIGNALGISKTRAYNDVDDALKEITREPAESLRDLELLRIDRLWQIAFKMAMKGDLLAMDRAVKLIGLRMKLLGLETIKNEVHIDAPGAIMEALGNIRGTSDDELIEQIGEEV